MKMCHSLMSLYWVHVVRQGIYVCSADKHDRLKREMIYLTFLTVPQVTYFSVS